MPAKRKAPLAAGGPVAKRVASAASTPRHNNDDDDDYSDETSEDEAAKQDEKEMEALVKRFEVRDKDYSRDDSVTHLFKGRDFSSIPLKPDHESRPLWIDPNKGRIIVESFSPRFKDAENFLINIAEPQSRVNLIHEYTLTPHSLFAAVSVGLSTEDIIRDLESYSKTQLPETIIDYIRRSTSSFGKVRLVLKHNKYWIESNDPQVLQKLLKDTVISKLRVSVASSDAEVTTAAAPKMGGLVIAGTKLAAGAKQAIINETTESTEVPQNPDQMQSVLLEDEDDDQPDQVHSFEVPGEARQEISKRCKDLDLPLTEEYDFRDDFTNANLEIDLKPAAQIRPYQEQALHKMFGNGRARSGIIVLPCGAGKTLVGITAACTVKKGIIVLCTSTMSAVQWMHEFRKWSNCPADAIATFTSDNKSSFRTNTGIVISTYTMMSGSVKNRAHDTKRVMDFIENREWGLMILDEVHVAPAEMFKKVTYRIKAHSKLGLTATLLREDDKITDLNFLIGPKLYEANWQELSEQGHIAKVQCAEVWCPMTTEFYSEYLKATDTQARNLLSSMNPRKFQAAQFLINYHESRGDKIIVFSDNLFSLETYAKTLNKPYIYGETPNAERLRILENFQYNDLINTIFLSKIGDTSLDLPEATCLIQISSHYGSRRQEAQRLGRILRAKRRNDEGFNAFFYSLVSKDTQEMFYSAKRQAFLVDQGYAFKVITQLQGMSNLSTLAFNTPQERRELLSNTLLEAEKKKGAEKIEGDLYSEAHPGKRKKKKGAAKRTAGMLADFSGGQNMAYVEYNKSRNKDLKGKGNSFMRKLRREQDKKKAAFG
jgi:DNA excision repair protein ERCC-3